jgi:p-aminobenzoyl-glutamate transporter AbgT
MKYEVAFSLTGICAMFISTAAGLVVDNADLFTGISAAVILDGVFGVLAGIKSEGFKTYKAVKIFRTLAVWYFITAMLLFIERAYGVSFLTQSVLAPFILFQVISALKNASIAGYINGGLLKEMLDKLDKHKDKK